MPDAIKRIWCAVHERPWACEIKAKELTNVNVDQYFIRVKEQEKFDTMTRLMDVDQPELSIVFGRTKRRVDELTRGLKLRGFRAEGIHGDLDQNKRLRVIRDFKNDQIDILVATDVQRVVLTFQVSLTSTTTIFHKIQKATFTVLTYRTCRPIRSIYYFRSTKRNGLLGNHRKLDQETHERS